jgi:hypothetical protein
MDIAEFVLFISACASLFGFCLFLFRDEVFSSTTSAPVKRRRHAH